MLRVVVAVAVLWALVAASGCTGQVAAPVGRHLGAVAYVRDRKPAKPPVTWVYAGAELAGLTTTVAGLGEADVTEQLRSVDPASEVVVTLYFDACAKTDPALIRDGATLTVRYGQELNRNCVRAVDTLALFAVPRAQLPDPVGLEVCGRTITLTRDGVTGDPIGLC